MRSGKRLRPILAILAYLAVGGKNIEKYIPDILAFELFHNHTLIHDDVYDEDDLRRHETAVHILFEDWFKRNYKIKSDGAKIYKTSLKRCGAVSAIITGKYLLTISSFPILHSKVLSDRDKVRIMKLHQKVSIYDNTGQAIDLMFEEDDNIHEQDYFNMVLCKTGMLFKASILTGALIGKATEKQLKVLEQYANEIVIAFQIKDDLMDIGKGTKGRGLGSDIKHGKKTLLVIHTLKNATGQDKKVFLEVLGNKKATLPQIRKAIDIMGKAGSIEYCKAEAKKRIRRAIKELDKAKPPLKREHKQALAELASYMLNRDR